MFIVKNSVFWQYKNNIVEYVPFLIGVEVSMKNLKINKKIVAFVLSAVIGISSGSYVVVKQFEYKKIISRVDSELEQENQKFIDLIENLEIQSIEIKHLLNHFANIFILKILKFKYIFVVHQIFLI